MKSDSLHDAARRGDCDGLNALLGAHTDLVFERDANGQTALHSAASRGWKEGVALLLAKGADVNAKSCAGWTALHTAVSLGHKDVTELLLKCTADLYAATSDNQTAWQLASAKNDTDMLKVLNAFDFLGLFPNVELGRKPEWLENLLHGEETKRRQAAIGLLRISWFPTCSEEAHAFFREAWEMDEFHTAYMKHEAEDPGFHTNGFGAILQEELLTFLRRGNYFAGLKLLQFSLFPNSVEDARTLIAAAEMRGLEKRSASFTQGVIKDLEAKHFDLCAAALSGIMPLSGQPREIWENFRRIGRPAVPVLVHTLEHSRPAQRRLILRRLWNMRDVAIPALEEMRVAGASENLSEALNVVRSGRKPPSELMHFIGSLSAKQKVAISATIGLCTLGIALLMVLSRDHPGDAIRIEADVDDVHLDESRRPSGDHLSYYPGHAFATGKGTFTVQASDSPAIVVGSVWSIEGQDTTPRSIEISRNDENTRPEINFVIHTPRVTIPKKARVKGLVLANGEVFGTVWHGDGPGSSGNNTTLSATFRVNDVKISLYPNPARQVEAQVGQVPQQNTPPVPTPPALNEYADAGISVKYPRAWQQMSSQALSDMKGRMTNQLRSYGRTLVVLGLFSSPNQEVEFTLSKVRADTPVLQDDILAERQIVYKKALNDGTVTKLNQLDKTNINSLPAVVEDFEGNNAERLRSVKVFKGNFITEFDLIVNNKQNYSKYLPQFEQILASFKEDEPSK